MPAPRRQTVLITGSSAGIGRAAALAFAQAGWNVAASMRTPEASPPLGEYGHRLFTPRLDVNDEASINTAIDSTLSRFGRIDVLVNNAGYMLMGPLEAWTDPALADQFNTNLFGLVRVTRAVLPHMRAARDGVIINVSSIGGRMAFPLGAAYHASKFAVEGLSEAMRFELRPHNIRVKVVEPGGIKTDFVNRGLRWTEHPAYAATARPMQRLMKMVDVYAPGPEPVARVILRAASDRSHRLRYAARPGPFLALNRLLPDALWRAALNTFLTRADPGPLATPSAEPTA